MSAPFVVRTIPEFDPDKTFFCGQCFRWDARGGGLYEGVAGGRILTVRRTGGQFRFSCSEQEFEEVWRPYFDLDRDYGAIREKLSTEDPVMAKACAAGAGIRILRQDIWETILSFLLSQNNNIRRIRGCIERLADLAGEPVGVDTAGMERRSLPAPDQLARMDESDLADVRLGYRAKYVIGTARCVAERGLPETYEELLELPGVGPKVASCIALFSLGETGRFPVDVWIARAMQRCYGRPEEDHRKTEAFAADKFGPLGGFAQQYLFYWIRSQEIRTKT